MRKMKNSGIEWIGEIPEEWSVRKVKDGFIRKNEKAHIEDPVVLSLARSGVKVRDLSNNDGQIAESYFDYNPVEPGDLLLNPMDLYSGANCSISKVRGVISPAYVNLRYKEGFNASFYDYYFKTQYWAMALFAHGKGVSFDNRWTLSKESLMNYYIPTPSLSEQTAIATYLDRKCSEIDSIVRETEQTIEEYKKLKQSLITEVVTGKKRVAADGLSLSSEPHKMKNSGVEWIGYVPEEWGVLKIKWLLSERNERSILGIEEPLSMSQKYGVIPTRQMDIVPNMASSFEGAKLVYVGDLVFNKLKAHLGVFSTSKYEGLVSPDYAVYYGTGKADVTYLEYLFKTPQCIFEFKKFITGVGAGLSRLYTSDLFNIYCPVPSKEEQLKIRKYLLTKCSEIDKLIADKQTLLQELDTYKKSLIYECVTGKREIN